MTINQENYRSFPAVSNSDLSSLQKYWLPEDRIIDLEKAYANGTLFDALLTEKWKVNYFKYRVDGEKYQYTKEEFERSEQMKKAAAKDPFIAHLLTIAAFQKISYNPAFNIEHEGFKFTLPAKAKWDAFVEGFDMNGDFKSTACTTQKSCEEAMRYFNYDRQAAWYLDLENRNNFMLMFVSKVNFKVFKIPVKRDGEIYKSGKAKYQKLAWEWWSLFSDINLDPQPTGILYTPTVINYNPITIVEAF